MDKTPKFFQHLRAPNSPNGNPQRLFVVYDDGGSVLAVIDEGYKGLPVALRGVPQLPTVEIARAAYHEWKREYKGSE